MSKENTYSMRLKSLKDLVKLVGSHMGGRPMGYIGYIEFNNKHIYFLFNTSVGYWLAPIETETKPIIAWTETEQKPEGSFIRYRTSPKEQLQFTDDTTDATYPLNIPIVIFEELPEFMQVWK